jgi:diguanylate cyclase (GGDEF)-like protein/PAS domain S-box-containing protein
MLSAEIRELINYLKNSVSEEKPDDPVFEKYGADPDFLELDKTIKGIRNSCKTHFEKIFDLLPDPTIITTMEDGKLLVYNKAFLQLIETRGKKIMDESMNIHDLYFELDKRDQLVAELKQTGISDNMEIRVNDANDEMFVAMVSSQVINIEGTPHILSVIRDVTEIKKMEVEIKRLAITDKLTQVFNRPKLDEILGCELERSERTKAPFSIIIVDIDLLKSINEEHGNQWGDVLLVGIADILKEQVRSTDIVGRWGGEEFLIILPDTDVKGAVILAEKLRVIIAETKFEQVGKLTASFGVAAYQKDLLPATIISRAYAARNQAKEKGRNRVEWQ